MGRVRIALTISGATSLGAFEGGALAALITGVQAVQRLAADPEHPDLRIDALGGASAGAITAVLAAQAVAAGLDPVEMMSEAWVRKSSVASLLKPRGGGSPLSMDGLAELAPQLLNPAGPRDPARVQRFPVRVHLSLCNLRGMNYVLRRLRCPNPTSPLDRQAGDTRRLITACTYLDRDSFVLGLGQEEGPDPFTVPMGRTAVEAALASGANPLGFGPRSLTVDRALYERDGVDNLPEGSGPLWYTDGGTLQNEPLGRTLDLTNDIDRDDPIETDDRRVHLLIHPFPEAVVPRGSASWAGVRPTWLRVLLRAGGVLLSQSLYADLKRAEKVNSRVIWQERLSAALDGLVAGLPPEHQARWRAELSGVLDDLEADLAQLGPGAPPPARTDATPVSVLLRRALQQVSGLAGKSLVAIDVVSPYLAEGTEGVALTDLLAGEFLFAFGGFFDEGLRWSDFALGFVCMLNWMDRGLAGYGLEPEQVDAALAAALRAFHALPPWSRGGETKGFTGYGLSTELRDRAGRLDLPAQPSWTPGDFGRTTVRSLPFRRKLTLFRLVWRVARVIAGNLWLRLRGKDSP